MLAVAIMAGLLIGVSLGALGGGGSILTVPALVYLLHESPHAATTGSLLIVGISALAGMAAHWRAGRVRVMDGLTFGLLGIGGSYLGSTLSASVDPHLLLTAFTALILIAAAAMVRRCRADTSRRSPAKTAISPTSTIASPPAATRVGVVAATSIAPLAVKPPLPRIDPRRVSKVVVIATAVGLLTGFFGVGGGFVIVPALVLALGFEMPAAVGTSLLVIVINSGAALLSRLGAHTHLDWPMLGLFTITAIAGSLAGHRIASRVNPTKLTAGFIVLLVAVAVYTAARSLPHLL